MPHFETAVLLRAILEELCTELSLVDADTRTRVVSKLLKAAEQGRCSLDDLREVGRQAQQKTPTMWPCDVRPRDSFPRTNLR
jgi:hypothetical protein